MPKTAKVFKSGNSQAVRLPKDFRLDVDEVEISKEGEAIILRPLTGKKVPWQHLCARHRCCCRACRQQVAGSGQPHSELR